MSGTDTSQQTVSHSTLVSHDNGEGPSRAHQYRENKHLTEGLLPMSQKSSHQGSPNYMSLPRKSLHDFKEPSHGDVTSFLSELHCGMG